MRRLIVLISMGSLMSSLLYAQFQPGDVELICSGSAGSRTYNVSGTYDHSDSYKFFFLGVAPGIYVAQGFALEPEIAVTAIEKELPAWYFLANVSYTFPLPESRILPFLRAGYGVSNGILLAPGELRVIRSTDKMNVGVMNLGAGLKFRVAGPTFLRIEANYKHYGWSEEFDSYYYSYPSYKSSKSSVDYSYGDFGLLVGFSVLL